MSKLDYSQEEQITKSLVKLFENYFNFIPEKVVAFEEHASPRKRYRLCSGECHAVGVFGPNFAENKAFIDFTQTFRELNVAVPEIYTTSEDGFLYLEQDLGQLTLFDLVKAQGDNVQSWNEDLTAYYRQALSDLVNIQVLGGQKINYDLCFQSKIYDRSAILSDLKNFQDNFLKRLSCKVDFKSLNRQFSDFADYLQQANEGHFIHRDFQARNIMVKDSRLFYIDYQTGRQGPVQCDVVSLLYQSQAGVPELARESLLQHYKSELVKLISFNEASFDKYYHSFVVLRLMQVLATYGAEGLGNKKPYFYQGIPIAVNLLYNEVRTNGLALSLPEIEQLVLQLPAAIKDI